MSADAGLFRLLMQTAFLGETVSATARRSARLTLVSPRKSNVGSGSLKYSLRVSKSRVNKGKVSGYILGPNATRHRIKCEVGAERTWKPS